VSGLNTSGIYSSAQQGRLDRALSLSSLSSLPLRTGLRRDRPAVRAVSEARAWGKPETHFYFYRGRTALYALLRALEVKAGDEVIVQAYTCLAVILPIIGLGAIPVYIDVLPGTYSMDAGALAERITSRTRALVIQHTFGIPADLGMLLEIAREHRVPVIEDCCHVHGSTYQGRPVGSFGVGAFYSFHWSKPLAVGRGGLAVVNDPVIASRVADFHACCSKPSTIEVISLSAQYAAFRLLRSSRFITDIHTMLRSWSPNGLATGQFRRAELDYKISEDYSKTMVSPTCYLTKTMLRRGSRYIERRRRIGGRLHALARRLGISRFDPGPEASVVFMSYPLHTSDRKRVIREGRAHGVEITEGFVSPVDPLGSGEWSKVRYRAGSCPVAEHLSEKTITVPVHTWARKRDIRKLLGLLEVLTAQGLLDVIRAT
jgi:perosamine synthetase